MVVVHVVIVSCLSGCPVRDSPYMYMYMYMYIMYTSCVRVCLPVPAM